MDKDLTSAMMLERCACYDKALDAAKRVLAKGQLDSDDAFLARKIIQSLGEEFLKQRFMEKAMECYQALTDFDPESNQCPDTSDIETFTDLGPNNIEVKTMVSTDIAALLKTIVNNECSSASNLEDLLREALYLLILKYASNQEVRHELLNRLEKVIKKHR